MRRWSEMARFQLGDSIIVDTERAAQHWEESTDWDGRNHINRATGSQWYHEDLYRSKKGRYYLVSSSNYQCTRDSAEELTPREAAIWLLKNGHDLPEELAGHEEEVLE